MRLIATVVFTAIIAVSCGSSGETASSDTASATTPSSTTQSAAIAASDDTLDDSSEKGPGGYGFDRSDPASGVANIMAAFATDEDTATCIYEAWGDVANVPPDALTPELMTFEICGTSIFEMISGDPRFTGADG